MADKIVSNLESVVAVTGDMLLPVENGVGTFAASVDDIKDYVEENLEGATTILKGKTFIPSLINAKNNVSDANNDIDFTTGVFNFSDGSGQAILPALTKRKDAAWAVGTNQGAMDVGTNTTLGTNNYWFAIYGPSVTPDIICSQSPTAPTLPSGYTKSKRILTTATDGSNNLYSLSYFSGFVTNSKQITFCQVQAIGSGATAIPWDDTKPQNTEGVQYMNAGHAPLKIGNWLHIQATVHGDTDSSNLPSAALFRDSVTDALEANTVTDASTTLNDQTIELWMQADTLDKIDFKVRAGAASGTFYFNSSAGNRKFGGIRFSSLKITEYLD